jgi:4-hydroxyphenylpyruvate dioxygenase
VSLSIATVCLSGTLEDKLAAVAAAGFDGIELFENDLVVSDMSPGQVRERCADFGLTIDLYQPFRDFEAVPPDVLAANLRRAERKFDVMAELGVDTVLVCSSVSPDAVDDDDLAAEQLHQLADRAARRGMRVAYEALAWGRFVDTFDHSWRIVRSAGHPALGLCLDSFHVLSRDSDPAGIRVIPGDRIFFLQLADAPKLRMDVLLWSRHHRLFPGQGAFDLAGFVRLVRDTGYDGPLSLEVFNDVFRQADPNHTAVDAMRSLLVLQEKSSPPKLTGHASAEITTDDPALPETLAALGLRRTITVREGTTRIAALTMVSEDPAASLRHAETLLADRKGHGVEAPDGTTLFFDTASAVSEDGFVTGIDHVSLSAPFDDVDQTALFYRAVLGLDAEPEAEFAAPFGLVRSLSASNGHVRIAHNVAVLRRGDWAPAVQEPQHIAFTTADALAAAGQLRARGARLLDIGDNYYDDLDARLAPPRLEELRAHSVLYDRDDHGEYLHFYTHILGGRVFFEIVQRVGDYRGYGVANSPVRMAAHRRTRLREFR